MPEEKRKEVDVVALLPIAPGVRVVGKGWEGMEGGWLRSRAMRIGQAGDEEKGGFCFKRGFFV